MWLNGRPQCKYVFWKVQFFIVILVTLVFIFVSIDLGVKLRLAEDADVIFVEQGQTFDMHLECVDEEGNVARLGTYIYSYMMYT